MREKITVSGNALYRAAGMGMALAGLTALAGCHIDMWKQNRITPYQESAFFANGQSARPIPAHTVARNPYGEETAPANAELHTDNPFYTGFEPRTSPTEKPKLVTAIPMEALDAVSTPNMSLEERTAALLHRGQERFNIFCSPCHGRLGDGNGMIAQRGLALRRKPASYHTAQLRKLPDGHFFDVITNGFGVMYSYASRVPPADRWAIVAYIRALQLSQNAKLSDVPPGIDVNNPAPPPAKEQTEMINGTVRP